MGKIDGKKLHERAKKSGTTMGAIAAFMGLTTENLAQRWKAKEPSINFIHDLAKATNKDISYYLDLEAGDTLGEPETEYNNANALKNKLLARQDELIDCQRDNIKDKSLIMELQQEKIKWLVNEGGKHAGTQGK